MMIAALFLGACGLAMGTRALVVTLRRLPGSNEDSVWY